MITSHDVERVFLSLDDDASKYSVARLLIIYLFTNHLFATPYVKVVDHYIFGFADILRLWICSLRRNISLN